MYDDPLESLHEGAGPLPKWYIRFLVGLLVVVGAGFVVYVTVDQWRSG
jgi:hypothetical protein